MIKDRPNIAIFVAALIGGVAITLFFQELFAHRFWGRDVPTLSECQRVVVDTTVRFAQAVKARDLSQFRQATAEEFQQAFSIHRFNEAFGGFIEQEVNLSPAQKFTPLFDVPPAFDQDEHLVLSGYFPTIPSRIYFDYQFKYKRTGWKIVGISIEVKSESTLSSRLD